MQINDIGIKKEQTKTKSKAKKYVLIGLIVSAVLLLLLLILLVLISTMTPKNLTLTVDGTVKTFESDVFIKENNTLYVSLRDIANLVGYRYYEGGYKQYNQDKSKCYLESDNEIVVYELANNKILKTLNNGYEQYSEFTISEPVKQSGDKLYVTAQALAKGCNLNFVYIENSNQIVINTLDNLYNSYNEKAKEGSYLNVETLDDDFSNKKTILYGMLVVKSTIKEQEKYGVISLDGSKVYLDIKYDEISFNEQLQEFLVKAESKYGVMSKDGKQIIKLDYDKLQLLDNINNLYYVEKNGKKGVLDRNGNALGGILYVEYDQVGISSNLFPSNNIENSMLLYDNCIPVKKGNKWAIFDKTGKVISDFKWDDLGYIETTTNNTNVSNTNNILLIEEVNGIVVCQNGKYGIVSSEGNLIVNPVYNKIYSETINGKELYYLQFENTVIELNNYLKEKEDKQTNNNEEQEKNNENVTPSLREPEETQNTQQETVETPVIDARTEE